MYRIGLLLALAVGCAPLGDAPRQVDGVFDGLQDRTVLIPQAETSTRWVGRIGGVAVHPGGFGAHASIGDMTCGITTDDGGITDDQNLSGEIDVVADAADDRLLVTWEGGVVIADVLAPGVDPIRAGLEGVADGELWEHGSVALLRDGVVVWLDDDGVVTERVASGALGHADLAVRWSDGLVMLADGVRVITAHPDGTVVSERLAATRVAWDDDLDRGYVARVGGGWVSAFDAGVRELWSTALPAMVRDVIAVPGAGAAGAAIHDEEGRRGVVFLDGLTGELTAVQALPYLGQQLEIDELGRTIAVVRPSLVAFYELDL